MITHSQRVLILLAVSACFLASSLSYDLIEPKVHSQSDSISLPPVDWADQATRISVAQLEFHRGEIVEYSFDASGVVQLTIWAKAIDPDAWSTPLWPLQVVRDTSHSDEFIADFHGIYRFIFTNLGETSDVEVSYAISHRLPLPVLPGVVLMILAVLATSYAIFHLALYRRWQTGQVSSGQQKINNLRERMRTESKTIWLRH